MALVPYLKRPRNELARIHDDVDDLFRSFFGDWGTSRFERTMWPRLDVIEKGDNLEVTAEVPGCRGEDIDISVQGNILTISGEKKTTEERKEEGYYMQERSYGSFRRDVTLPSEIDPSKIEATYKEGILHLSLPKSEKAKAVKVKVKEE